MTDYINESSDQVPDTHKKMLIITSGARCFACHLDEQDIDHQFISCGEYHPDVAKLWITDPEGEYLIDFASYKSDDHFKKLAIVCTFETFNETLKECISDKMKERLSLYPHLIAGPIGEKHANNLESIKAHKAILELKLQRFILENCDSREPKKNK